jgi:hypothetical protein
MQLFVLAALTLTTSLLRVPHGARTMPPAARAATAVASAAPDDDLALYEAMMEVAAAEDSALGRGLKQGLGVLTQALRLYGEDKVVTAFNGGKDAVVVLHLMRAALAHHRRQNPAEAGAGARQRVIFFEVKDEFPQVAGFLRDTAEQYNLEVVRYANMDFAQVCTTPPPTPPHRAAVTPPRRRIAPPAPSCRRRTAATPLRRRTGPHTPHTAHRTLPRSAAPSPPPSPPPTPHGHGAQGIANCIEEHGSKAFVLGTRKADPNAGEQQLLEPEPKPKPKP